MSPSPSHCVEASIGGGNGARLTPHPLRAVILGDVHARPFTSNEMPRRVLHFAFDTTGEAEKADRAALADFCVERGLEPLKQPDAPAFLTLPLALIPL